MKLKKLIIFVLLTILVSVLMMPEANAQFGKDFQDKEQAQMVKRIFVGGGIGFWIYPSDGYIYVSPVVGYHLSPSFDVGSRLSYSYYWYNDNFYKFNLNSYGIGFFGRYYLFFFRDLFVHAEYEYMSHEQPQFYNPLTGNVELTRVPVNNFYIGGGFRQWLSPSAFLGITILFNLNDTEYMPQNPIIRIGMGVGL